MISVLCALPNSVYKNIPGLDVWDVQRDAYYFTGSNPVIVHPPCAQWSRMRAFSKPNESEKELAYFCLTKVIRNGGIFEHPMGSSFFKEVGLRPTLCLDQFVFGFPARKRTWLYFHGCKPLAQPLRFDAIESEVTRNLNSKNGSRSKTTMHFATWLIDCIRQTA
jgi:hypothetical protein